jgi:hypothetical protein
VDNLLANGLAQLWVCRKRVEHLRDHIRRGLYGHEGEGKLDPEDINWRATRELRDKLLRMLSHLPPLPLLARAKCLVDFSVGVVAEIEADWAEGLRQLGADGILEHARLQCDPVALESGVPGEEGPLKEAVEGARLVIPDVFSESPRKNNRWAIERNNLKYALELVHGAEHTSLLPRM